MKIPPKLSLPNHPFDRIAFAGPMCSGKTTLADVLVDNFGYQKLSFSRLLKETAENLYGTVQKNNEGRKMLQEFSDDLKRWDKNLFITQLLLDADMYISKRVTKIVVDDLRYMTEYKELKKQHFTIIGVHCTERIRHNRIFSLYPDTDASRFSHPSETEWQKMEMDYWIDNTNISGISTLVGMMTTPTAQMFV